MRHSPACSQHGVNRISFACTYHTLVSRFNYVGLLTPVDIAVRVRGRPLWVSPSTTHGACRPTESLSSHTTKSFMEGHAGGQGSEVVNVIQKASLPPGSV